MRSIPVKAWRLFNLFAIEIILALLVREAVILFSMPLPEEWLLGDWLINYQGGFVRRGLLGEFSFRASHWLGIDLVLFILIFQLVVYLFFYLNTYRLISKTPFNATSAILIFSPAFLLFPVLSPLGAFRKEILFFAVLSALCIHLVRSNARPVSSRSGGVSTWLLLALGAASVVLVLSHEMLVVFLPYFLCALILHEGGLTSTVKKGILCLLPALVVAGLIIAFGKGVPQVAADICASLGAKAPLDCIDPTVPGAITFLGQTISTSHAFVLESINAASLTVYLLTAALGLLPLLLLIRTKPFRRIAENKQTLYGLLFFIGASLLGSLPLFWVVADYGRIIYIHIASLSLLALMVGYDTSDQPLSLNLNQAASFGASFLFIIGWRLLHWNTSFSASFPLLASLFTALFK